MPAVVYLARHASPDWSRTDLRYDVPPGPPLTAQGEQEAVRLGQFLQETELTSVVTSPLDRALQTARLVGQHLRLTPTVDNAVAEWQRGESEDDVLARVVPSVRAALSGPRTSGAVLFVTHGGPIRLLLQHFGLDAAEISHYRRQFDRDNPVPPSGVWRLESGTNGRSSTPTLVYTPQPFRAYEVETTCV